MQRTRFSRPPNQEIVIVSGLKGAKTQLHHMVMEAMSKPDKLLVSAGGKWIAQTLDGGKVQITERGRKGRTNTFRYQKHIDDTKWTAELESVNLGDMVLDGPELAGYVAQRGAQPTVEVFKDNRDWKVFIRSMQNAADRNGPTGPSLVSQMVVTSNEETRRLEAEVEQLERTPGRQGRALMDAVNAGAKLYAERGFSNEMKRLVWATINLRHHGEIREFVKIFSRGKNPEDVRNSVNYIIAQLTWVVRDAERVWLKAVAEM